MQLHGIQEFPLQWSLALFAIYMEKDEDRDAQRIARGKFRRRVFRRLTFYMAFPRATKWRSKSSFREFSSGARIIKRGRIFAQRFAAAGKYECISKNCLRASRAPREFARTTPPFCAAMTSRKIISRDKELNAWNYYIHCSTHLVKKVQNLSDYVENREFLIFMLI